VRLEDLRVALSRHADVAQPPATPAGTAGENDHFDLEFLQQLVDIDPEGGEGMLQHVFEMYFEDARRRLAGVPRAVEQSDSRELMRMGHALRGSSATVGLKRMAELAHRLEELGGTGSIAACAVLGKEMEKELTQAEQAVARVRTKLAAKA
jgi:HPt (histidine-containing phosphotransfer) domain-containing protein